MTEPQQSRLRPWCEVCRPYTERTGERMEVRNAKMIVRRAILKLAARAAAERKP